MNKSNPLVSVCMITYNQEQFIQQALYSVLDQECSFGVEVILNNDYSSDKTDLLIRSVVENHPKGKLINYKNNPSNLGMMENFLDALRRCSGKYIAMCEGDDYWLDTYKLQKQIDFLESNSEFVLTYHPVKILYPDGKLKRDSKFEQIMKKSESNIYDLASLGNYIHTPSVVFRNLLRSLPDSISQSPIGDYFIWILIAESGNIKKLDDLMAVYRFGVGVHSSQTKIRKIISFKKVLELLSNSISDPCVKSILSNRILAIEYTNLPSEVKVFGSLTNSSKSELLRDSVKLNMLLNTIWLKIKRRLFWFQ